MKKLAFQLRQFLPELVYICCLVSADLLVKLLSPSTHANYAFTFSLALPSKLVAISAWLLIAIASVWLYVTPGELRLRRASLVLVIAGGTANTIERALRGHVTDVFRLFDATINLADIYVIVGVSILLLTAFVPISPKDPN